MQQRGPPQTVLICLREAELLSNEVGVGAHPLTVPAGSAMMDAQRGNEREDPLGTPARLVTGVVLDRLGQPLS